jgi:hypothetical protein
VTTTRRLSAAALALVLSAAAAAAQIHYPPAGKTPIDAADPAKGFYRGGPAEDVQSLIIYHAPQLTGLVDWSGDVRPNQPPSSTWLREADRVRAFLRFAFPAYDYLQITDDPFLETDNYLISHKQAPLADRAPRHRTVEVIRLWGSTACNEMTKTCPWFIAAIDARDPAPIDVIHAEIEGNDDAAVHYQFGLRPDDRTAFASFQSFDGCDTVEPEYNVATPAHAQSRTLPNFLGDGKPQKIYPGTLVTIADDLSSATVCGHPHPISWNRPGKP